MSRCQSIFIAAGERAISSPLLPRRVQRTTWRGERNFEPAPGFTTPPPYRKRKDGGVSHLSFPLPCRISRQGTAGLAGLLGDDPLAFANSMNLSRDLTAAQRAIVAARQLILQGPGRPGPRFVRNCTDLNIGREAIAKQFRVSPVYVANAKAILERASLNATRPAMSAATERGEA